MSPAQRDRRLRRRIINTVAVIVAVLATSFYLVNIDRSNVPLLPPADKPTVTSPTPSSTAMQIATRKFRSDGALHYQFSAERVDYFEHPADPASLSASITLLDDLNMGQAYTINSRADIRQPSLVIYRDDGQQYTIDADTGTLYNRGERFQLGQQVVFSDTGNQATVRTEQLIFNSVLNEILTDQPLTISTPDASTRAVGLHANLDRDYWELISEVNSVVTP